MNRSAVYLLIFGVLFFWHLYHGLSGSYWSHPPLAHGDGPDYESIAYSLYHGDGFQFAWQSESWQKPYREAPGGMSYSQLKRSDWPGPTASRPPLYPLTIAAIYRFLPRGPLGFAAVRFFSIICTALAGTFVVWLAYRLSFQWWSVRWLAFVAAIATLSLALLDRTVRTYSVDFLTEPLAMLLCTCLAASGLQWQENHRPRWFACLITAVVAMILTRSMFVFWLPGLAVVVAASAERNRLRYGLLFLALVFLGLSPWWIRNCIVLDRLMPLGGQGAASLSGGYCDDAFEDHGNWNGRVEEDLQREIDMLPGSDRWTQAQREVALADRAMARTWTWIHQHMSDLPSLMAMRVMTHWSPYHGSSLLWRLAIVGGWIGLIVLGRREMVWIFGLPVISTATVAVLYETGGRFLVPLYPLLYMTAGLGVAFASKWLFRKRFDLYREKRF